MARCKCSKQDPITKFFTSTYKIDAGMFIVSTAIMVTAINAVNILFINDMLEGLKNWAGSQA